MSKPLVPLTIAKDLVLFVASQAAVYFAFKVIMAQMDPQSSKRKEAKTKSLKALGKLGKDGLGGRSIKDLDLNEFEEIIAGEVVATEDIGVLFKGASGHGAGTELTSRRYRRTGSHHLPAARGRHLPAVLPPAVRLGRGALWRAQGRPAVRPAGLRQDDARQGALPALPSASSHR